MCLAIPARIEYIEDTDDDVFRQARVSFNGVKKNINLAFVPEASIGDYVLIHVGVAISLIDEKEALEVLTSLKEMGELDEAGQQAEDT